jgi:hypothetical protein
MRSRRPGDPVPETIPASFEVAFTDPRDGGAAVIYACPAHVAATIAEAIALGAVPAVQAADPARHGCKGHQEKWPAY